MNITDDNKPTELTEPSVQKPVKKRVKRIQNNFLKQFIVCFCCVIVCAIFMYHHEIKNVFQNLFFKADSISADGNNFRFGSRRQNILLMGVDVSDNKDNPFKNTRSDSIYLISIAPHGKNINVISIPRDSKVYIHGKSSPDKINHAFAYGGIDTSLKTIEQTLGVKIHHYIVVSNRALIDFIDGIGGIDVYVEKDMHYNDNTAGLHINLTKGIRHLNGIEAEGFMRYRKDALGDIGRIRRQQWFLNALAEKMKDPATIIRIPETLMSISKFIQTDFSFYELAQYAALMKTVDLSKVKVATLPGEPSQRGFISYWILNPEGVQDIVNSFVYGEKAKSLERPLEAGILYVPSKKEEALLLQESLEKLGVSVNIRESTHLGHDHIAIHSFDIPNDAIDGIKAEIPSLKQKQTVYDTIGFNKAGKDFTIILAGS